MARRLGRLRICTIYRTKVIDKEHSILHSGLHDAPNAGFHVSFVRCELPAPLMDLDLEINVPEVERGLSDLARRQLPFAMRLALNETAKAVKAAAVEMLKRRLNNPSRWTLRSLWVRYARGKGEEAEVRFREFAGKGIAAGKYLDHMETGGVRGATRFELALRAAGVLAADEFVTAAGMRRRGDFTRALSQLRALRGAGFQGNATGSARSRRARRRSGSVFVPGEPGVGAGSGLPRGIWQRKGGGISPLWWIVKGAPRYRRVLRFRETARGTAERVFPEALAKALERALATARR